MHRPITLTEVPFSSFLMSDSMLVRMRAHMTRSLCSFMCAWRTCSTTGSRMHRDSAEEGTKLSDVIDDNDARPPWLHGIVFYSCVRRAGNQCMFYSNLMT